MRLDKAIFLALALFPVTAPVAWAQHAGHPAAMPGMAGPAGTAPPSGAMMGSMDRMSKDMAAVPTTGDADRDFVAMMIPHHQGAIDMARQELAHGKDPVLRKLARDVIAAQEKEIGAMKQWQARHPVR